ncbi:hypothetical protein Acr_00g0077820 [Actinidia rufa]|uniref:Retrovirus-related Pol polyprotein from transposon TNT 1-94-like beta-barrel domain-containing protein n=1 Tax=Actinidia rufa TaxID=165716 RepID=A0A7J0DUP5_9ERIC|nr:hypothetical protein Acr_00g0077820 [Actinidia rufa]
MLRNYVISPLKLIGSRTFTLAIEARRMSEFIEGPVTQPEKAVAFKKFKSHKSTSVISGISVGSYMVVLLVGEGVDVVVMVEVSHIIREMQALRGLMAQADSSPTIIAISISSYLAHTDILANAFTTSSSVPWIIDSSVSNHMTGCSSIFDSYLTCSGKDKVKIADGSFSSISRKGTGNGKGDWQW